MAAPRSLAKDPTPRHFFFLVYFIWFLFFICFRRWTHTYIAGPYLGPTLLCPAFVRAVRTVLRREINRDLGVLKAVEIEVYDIPPARLLNGKYVPNAEVKT